MSPVPPGQAGDYDPTARQKQDAKLHEAVNQYEQVFLKQLFKEMRKSVPKTDIMGEKKDNKEQEMFEDMLDDQRAKAWTESGGIGLASMMYEQLRRQNGQT